MRLSMTTSSGMRRLVLSSQLLLVQCLPPTTSSVATLCLNDITANGQTWTGIDFLYPPDSAIYGYVAILPNSPHIHHVDFNCCPLRRGGDGDDVPPTLTEGVAVNVSLPAEADRRQNCYRHYESVVWTYPQEDPRLTLPSRTVIAVGPGTICEYGYLEVHVREATTTGPGRACVEVPLRPLPSPEDAAAEGGGGDDGDGSLSTSIPESAAAAEEEPSDLGEGDETNEEERQSPQFYAQVVYFYASGFSIPSSASFWRVSTTRRYVKRKTQTRAVPFEVFAFKMHTHWRGVSMSVRRVRGSDSTLIGTGDPSATQNWQYTNAMNDATPSESRAWVEEGDELELECIYDARETDQTIRNCNGEQCEMCWVYLQVRTEELVTERLMERMEGRQVVSEAYHDPSSLEEELEEEVDEEEGEN